MNAEKLEFFDSSGNDITKQVSGGTVSPLSPVGDKVFRYGINVIGYTKGSTLIMNQGYSAKSGERIINYIPDPSVGIHIVTK